jgi:hypothetical protein
MTAALMRKKQLKNPNFQATTLFWKNFHLNNINAVSGIIRYCGEKNIAAD